MEDEETELVYVMIPGAIGPMDRGDLFEDPIGDELQRTGFGYVSGGGSSLGDEQPDGSRQVEFCGIDVEAFHLDKCLEMLREFVPSLDCPAGTQLHYSKGDVALQDEFDGASWTTGHPRAMMHPAFGT